MIPPPFLRFCSTSFTVRAYHTAAILARQIQKKFPASLGCICNFTLTCNAGKESHVGYAELVKTQLEQFGIPVVLETLDADSYNAKTSNKFSENNITMEAAIYGYTAAGIVKRQCGSS